MGDQNKMIYTTKNRLVTLKCKKARSRNDVPPVYLVCLVETEKVDEKVEGWILIISGNPIIPHGMGEWFPNKIHIDKLLAVTNDQKAEILQASIIPDGFVYLYAGNFLFSQPRISNESGDENLDILKLLSYYLGIYQVEIDLESTVPLKEGLINIIIQCEDPKYSGGRKAGESRREAMILRRLRKSKKDAVLTIRNDADNKFIFVDFERPSNHTGYEVDVYFFQSFNCKSDPAHNYQRRRITRRLEKCSIVIRPPPSKKGKKKLSEHERACFSSSHRGGSESKVPVTTTVKVLEVPTCDSFVNREVLDIFTVKSIDYCVIARLTKKGEWCGETKAVLFRQEIKETAEDEDDEAEYGFPPPVAGPSSSIQQQSSGACRNATNSTFPQQPDSQVSSSSSSAPYDIPVKLVIFEMLLISPEDKKKSTPNLELQRLFVAFNRIVWNIGND